MNHLSSLVRIVRRRAHLASLLLLLSLFQLHILVMEFRRWFGGGWYLLLCKLSEADLLATAKLARIYNVLLLPSLLWLELSCSPCCFRSGSLPSLCLCSSLFVDYPFVNRTLFCFVVLRTGHAPDVIISLTLVILLCWRFWLWFSIFNTSLINSFVLNRFSFGVVVLIRYNGNTFFGTLLEVTWYIVVCCIHCFARSSEMDWTSIITRSPLMTPLVSPDCSPNI